MNNFRDIAHNDFSFTTAMMATMATTPTKALSGTYDSLDNYGDLVQILSKVGAFESDGFNGLDDLNGTTATIVGIKGHAVAETPAGVARALLYVLEGSFFLYQSINHSYHTFHQQQLRRPRRPPQLRWLP